ncbi:protein of unknown function [Xenorhabdus poinarii G6]|uniref:Uncharacterized protein n=1 Tax=Xenorhabdus poinarii G6 TaxID=1354304 RepID=A0A068R2X1_9GAMM|nr:protein of unknown function [Xenorhabdus poinarii G6]
MQKTTVRVFSFILVMDQIALANQIDNISSRIGDNLTDKITSNHFKTHLLVRHILFLLYKYFFNHFPTRPCPLM